MDTDGFVLLKGFAEPRALQKIVEHYREKTEFIFNGTGRNDHKRRQVKLPLKLMKTLQEKLQAQHPQHQIQEFVLLRSLPGCQQQQAHTDYIPTSALLTCPSDQLPLLFVFALEPNTRLVVWPGSHKIVRGLGRTKSPLEPTVLVLEAGDAVLFRADLVHAGAEYDSENIRIHCYLDSPTVPRDPNRTFIIQKHADSLIQEKIVEP
jgi:hypothetical protein